MKERERTSAAKGDRTEAEEPSTCEGARNKIGVKVFAYNFVFFKTFSRETRRCAVTMGAPWWTSKPTMFTAQ